MLPRDVDDLKAEITEALNNINKSMLGRILQEVATRLNVCV